MTKSGTLRRVQGKRTLVLNGYVTETVDGKSYRLRYAADENGQQPFVASREEAAEFERGQLPNFIAKPTHQSGSRPSGGNEQHYIDSLAPGPASQARPPTPPASQQVRPPPRQTPPPPAQPAYSRPSHPQSSSHQNIVLEDPSGNILLQLRNPTSAVLPIDEKATGDGLFPEYLSGSGSASPADSDDNEPLVCTRFSAGCILNMDAVFEKLTKQYDRKVRPNVFESPTQVWANLRIRSLLGINEIDMEFKLSLELKVDWTDERLVVVAERLSFLSPDMIIPTRVLVDAEQAARIWTPQVTVLNEKDSVDSSEMFDKGSLVWNPQSGKLTLTKFGIITLPCEMFLQNFPMDAQKCGVWVGSNFHAKREIDLGGEVELDPNFVNLVKNMKLANITADGRDVENGSRGSGLRNIQTILECDLVLERYVGYYLIGTFFPAALVVIISWLTFWMPRKGSAERMALGVTCVLTITTLLISAQSSSPKVSYVKAIDVYMGVCFGLVFSTLLQSTLIGHWLRKGHNSDYGSRSKVGSRAGGPESEAEFTTVVKRVMAGGIQINLEEQILKKSKMSDTMARILFPLLFVIFNVAYWSVYGTIGSSLNSVRENPPIKGSWFGNMTNPIGS